jgi:hypothetical protein
MSYIDSDGDTCKQGITLGIGFKKNPTCDEEANEMLKAPLEAHIVERTSTGSSSMVRRLDAGEYCSYKCFAERVHSWLESVEKAACKVPGMQ